MGCFHKAWLGYCIALHKNEDDKALYYASIIQRLQIQVREFTEVGMFGSAIEKELSNLAVINPFNDEGIQDAKEDEDDHREVNLESL